MAASQADSIIIDTFIVSYLDNKSKVKLYFKLKIIWLKKKSLVKIVIMDQVNKKSSSIVEKMPESVSAKRTPNAMAKSLKSMVGNDRFLTHFALDINCEAEQRRRKH